MRRDRSWEGTVRDYYYATMYTYTTVLQHHCGSIKLFVPSLLDFKSNVEFSIPGFTWLDYDR